MLSGTDLFIKYQFDSHFYYLCNSLLDLALIDYQDNLCIPFVNMNFSIQNIFSVLPPALIYLSSFEIYILISPLLNLSLLLYFLSIYSKIFIHTICLPFCCQFSLGQILYFFCILRLWRWKWENQAGVFKKKDSNSTIQHRNERINRKTEVKLPRIGRTQFLPLVSTLELYRLGVCK